MNKQEQEKFEEDFKNAFIESCMEIYKILRQNNIETDNVNFKLEEAAREIFGESVSTPSDLFDTIKSRELNIKDTFRQIHEMAKIKRQEAGYDW